MRVERDRERIRNAANGEMVAVDHPSAIRQERAVAETILEEAQRLVTGDRQDDYDHPSHDFAKTAKMITGILLPKLCEGEEVTPTEAILCVIAVKMSREVFKHKRDNPVDIAGYAALLQMLHEQGESA